MKQQQLIHKGKAGAAFKDIHNHLRDVEPLAAAGIALKDTFDKCIQHQRWEDTVVKVTEAIGQAVEQECQMQYYERTCPGLLKINQGQLLAPCMWYTSEVGCCTYAHQQKRCNALEDVDNVM